MIDSAKNDHSFWEALLDQVCRKVTIHRTTLGIYLDVTKLRLIRN